MVTLRSSTLEKSIEVNRIIGAINGSGSGPTAIFVGGIHGNEPAGVFALHNVLESLKKSEIPIKGNIYAIAGNLWALEKGRRYQEEDLNRLWSKEKVQNLRNGALQNPKNQDVKEQIAIYATCKDILDKEAGPFYFFDLHTTSSETMPFITVNDNLLNRKFTSQYPIPIVLGIEEYLEGPLLSFVNELGYVAFGFEGGQHEDVSSIENHKAFVYLSLVFTGCLAKEDIDFDHQFGILAKHTLSSRGFYEIFNHYKINNADTFLMNPGFVNFQSIKKGQELAVNNKKLIISRHNGRIFMPLYQRQGGDGFFIVRSIPPFLLRLSALLRKIRLDQLLTYLPGVRWQSKKRDALVVNRKLARYFTKDFFHLLGYRSKKIDRVHLVMKNRETVSRKKDYKNESWWNKNGKHSGA
jgi:hypothetical protein